MPRSPVVGGHKWKDELRGIEYNEDEVLKVLRLLEASISNDKVLTYILKAQNRLLENKQHIAELMQMRDRE